jgi:ABC-2 type transport system ATP-binding protein
VDFSVKFGDLSVKFGRALWGERMTSSPIISTSGLVKSFGNNIALNELELQVPKGISGFIGKNGAGKTTTISILLGLLKPNRGKATVFGMDCWHESFEIRRRVGVLHETNAFPGGFTGKRFLEHVARIYGTPQTEARVKESLKEVGLSGAEDKRIKTYSAGMTRRLGLAQALIGDPEFVILDEPTANIDPLGRTALLDRIKKLHTERGTSFLISTHILSELEKVCGWLSIIDSGKIVDQGPVKELAKKHSADIYKIEVSDPGLLLENVQQLKIVEKAWIDDGKVYCKVSHANEFYEELPKIAARLRLQLKGFQHTRGTIEEIYREIAGNE